MTSFKVGDRVRYASGIYTESESNPLWGGKYGNTAGTISNIYSLENNIFVKWDNGSENAYNNNDLDLIKEAPQGKPYTIKGKTYYAFPEGKTIKELDLSKKFIVISNGGRKAGYGNCLQLGDIVKIVDTSKETSIPYVECLSNGAEGLYYTHNLAYYDEEVEEDKNPIEKTVDIMYNAIQDNLRMAVNPIYLGADYSNNNLTPSGNKFMSNIVKFAKDAALAVSNPDEKLRREVGLKDEKGNWNNDATTIVLDLEAQSLGYKDTYDMVTTLGIQGGFACTAFELHALFAKYDAKLLEIAKAKKAEDKK